MSKGNNILRDKIISIMRSNKITYQELANSFGTSHQNVYKIVNKDNYKMRDIILLCDALNIELELKVTGKGITIIDSTTSDISVPPTNNISSLGTLHDDIAKLGTAFNFSVKAIKDTVDAYHELVKSVTALEDSINE